MKKFTLIITAFMITKSLYPQQNYCDFEGTKVASLAEWNGTMDSMHVNPSTTGSVNPSAHCGMYIRSTTLYDNFKYFPYSKMQDMSAYANGGSGAPKMTMKVYTSAPAGTQINLQLGVRSNTTYPAGVHSEYTAMTTAQRAWHTVTFNYVQTTPGSTVMPTDIDKIVIFLHPNSSTVDTMYFDDFTGPALIVIGVPTVDPAPILSLSQNHPNPANDNSTVTLSLGTPGHVSLRLFDMFGKQVSTLLEGPMQPGTHEVPINTAGLASGVYFYALENNGARRTMKMTVLH